MLGKKKTLNLHSNMVRFIIKYLQVAKRRSQRFTFQYG